MNDKIEHIYLLSFLQRVEMFFTFTLFRCEMEFVHNFFQTYQLKKLKICGMILFVETGIYTLFIMFDRIMFSVR